MIIFGLIAVGIIAAITAVILIVTGIRLAREEMPESQFDAQMWQKESND